MIVLGMSRIVASSHRAFGNGARRVGTSREDSQPSRFSEQVASGGQWSLAYVRRRHC